MCVMCLCARVCMCVLWISCAGGPVSSSCGARRVDMPQPRCVLSQGLDWEDSASYRLLTDMHVVSPLSLCEAALPHLSASRGSIVSHPNL